MNFKLKNYIIIIFISIIPGILISLLVLASYFGLWNSFDDTIISQNGRYRGFEGIATEFGNKMALYTTFTIFGFIYFKRKLIQTLFIVLSIMFSFIALLSGSFGAGLILYVTVLLYTLLGFKKKIFPKIIGITSLVFIIYQYYNITVNQNYDILIYLPTIMQDRFATFGNEFGSIVARMNINEIAFKDFMNNPFLGFGYGQYQFNNDYQISVHNTILSAAVELGFLGMIGVILYIVIPVFIAYKLRKKMIFNYEYMVLTNFFLIYSIVRLVNTLKAQEYVDREPWIPILMIFILYSQIKSRKILIKED